MECGVFKGTSFARFALMRQLLGGDFSSKIIGFDVFSDDFPDTNFEEDKAQREHWIETAGASSISIEQLSEILNLKRISNFELIPGDATKTIPEYCENHRGMRISILNVDIDFVEPTKIALQQLVPRVVKGGIVLLDNYAGVGTSGLSYHGDTRGIDEYIGETQLKLKRFPFAARPCYFIKE